MAYFDNTTPQFTLFHNHHHQVLFFLFVSLPCGLLIKKVCKFAFSSDDTHDSSRSPLFFYMNAIILLVHPDSIKKQIERRKIKTPHE